MSPATVTTINAPRGPKPTQSPSPLERLLAIEGEAFTAKDQLSLKHMAVNRSRDLVGCGHVIWLSRSGHRLRGRAITAQEQFDTNTPFAQWLHTQLRDRAKTGTLDGPADWQFNSQRAGDSFNYPFIHAHFAPFAPDAQAGGLLFTRDTPFSPAQLPLLDRLGQVFGLADKAMGGKKRARMAPRKRLLWLGSLAVIACILAIPIPMTTLASAEIIPEDPFVISAQMDGVIDEILIEPNTHVAQGTPLIRFDDITLRNQAGLAERELALAEARARQAGLRSFIDPEAKRELAIAQAEIELSRARLSYARDQLERTVIRAPRDGIALYSDPLEWTGRPVSTGEAILKIAEPTRVLLRIDAPLAHGEALQSGTRVRMFLDSDPTQALDGELVHADYEATPTADGVMAFRSIARLDKSATAREPRIGSSGVAKIYGKTAPMGWWLVRKPVTLARQMTGL